MSATIPPNQPISRLADRLTTIRRGRFVGREAELELFRSALSDVEPPFAVLHVYGPGGVGKSTLLREYARLANKAGRPVILLDRDVELSPLGFEAALRRALDIKEGSTEGIPAHWPLNAVLMIDTYEELAALDGWLRETFLPQLPAGNLIVLAGRDLPAPAWRSDIAWAELTRFLPLRNLRPEESQTYLTVRGIPAEQHAGVLAFTHGHPLALSLVAEVMSQSDGLAVFNPQSEPDVVRVLLERFTQNVPGPQYRQALEICAHVHVTTEALLAEVLGAEDAHELFEWLRARSFIEQGPQGLFPHDLAREVLDADLRWRNPQAYRNMHRLVAKYFGKLIQRTHSPAQWLVMADITYLYRHNPITKNYYDWDTLGQTYPEPATAEDYPIILEMVQRHEGAASAESAQYWLQHQPQAFTIFRSSEDRFLGFTAILSLPAITAADAAADPAMAAAQHFIRRYGPLRSDETLDYVRFWMGRERYQVGDIHNLVTMTAGPVLRTNDPRRVWSFAAVADPDHWRPFFVHLNFAYTQDADFAVGGRRFGVFTHDWRTEPVSAWIKEVGERQLAADLQPARQATPASVPLVVLSEPEFAEAVRQALRDYTRPDMLAANPLLRSRLVVEAGEARPSSATLQTLLREAAESLTGNPKDQKLYRAIYHTYLEPAPTQEQAAELLNLPFNTYRYHLNNGLKRITAWLWQRDLHGLEP